MFHVERYGDSVAIELAKHIHLVGLLLSKDQFQQVASYATELAIWNKKTNLTAVTDVREVAIKHFLDSLFGIRALHHGEGDNSLLDIGSGAGFPGIALKIFDPDVILYLIEKNHKKASFLSSIVGKLQLKNVVVIDQDIRMFASKAYHDLAFGNIVVRAMKVDQYGPLLLPILREGGRMILYRTEPLPKADAPHGFSVLQNLTYELPEGYGRRVLSVLGRTVDVAAEG